MNRKSRKSAFIFLSQTSNLTIENILDKEQNQNDEEPIFFEDFVPKEKSFKIRESNPLTTLATYVVENMKKVDKNYNYSINLIKRELTSPSEKVHNEGRDNIEFNLIVCVNDVIISPDNVNYKIEFLLGNY